MTKNPLYQMIYRCVALIPHGNVATYGQIAKKIGIGNNARVVGYALHHLPKDTKVPWHRVVNARGMISLRGSCELQRRLLEQEEVHFDNSGKINLNKFRWHE
jgi:methylated-DNA-protein-cysteine methyltransferase-like protein